MLIKDGWDCKPTSIIVHVEGRRVQLWIKHAGAASPQDVVLYLTPTELHDLFRDVQDAARKLFKMED